MFASSNDSAVTPPLPTHIYHAPEVAKRQDTFIKRAKVLVAVALLIAVVAVAVSSYLLVSNQEKEGFENQVRRLRTRFKFHPQNRLIHAPHA